MKEFLTNNNIEISELNIDSTDWLEFDYSATETIYLYPDFLTLSGDPYSLFHIKDNLKHISEKYPHLRIYPDPNSYDYYNDKYKQFLFLKENGFSIPKTLPIFSADSIEHVINSLSFPMIVKNRHGAGGKFVFLIKSHFELERLYHASYVKFGIKKQGNLIIKELKKQFLKMPVKNYDYFKTQLSMPLIAQEKIEIYKDIRTVIVNAKVWEAHWRVNSKRKGFKTNIDAGADGLWSRIPVEIILECERLAKLLNIKWLGVDILYDDTTGKHYFTEFSPVWNHYQLNEKSNFYYFEDYNIATNVKEGHDFESMIFKTLYLNKTDYPNKSLL